MKSNMAWAKIQKKATPWIENGTDSLVLFTVTFKGLPVTRFTVLWEKGEHQQQYLKVWKSAIDLVDN